MSAEPAMLELRGVDVAYGGVAAVRDLSLEVRRGEIVGLIGPNGAGKSTTLHAIMGLVPARAGEILLSGQSLRGRAPENVAQSGVALVPEGRRIFAELSVEENLQLGLAGRRSREGAEADIASVYELFPIVEEFRRRPGRRTLRRPATAARDRPRARRGTGRAAARRAVPRPLADGRRHRVRGASRDP